MIDPFTFAIVKHHGQLRKGSDLPYVVHPIEVHNILKECGFAKDILLAGLFHDIAGFQRYTDPRPKTILL